jgi:hypothetical protein
LPNETLDFTPLLEIFPEFLRILHPQGSIPANWPSCAGARFRPGQMIPGSVTGRRETVPPLGVSPASLPGLADGFYEWQHLDGKKQSWYFRMRDGQPFAFAGLWERSSDQGKAVETCTLLTTEANDETPKTLAHGVFALC